MRSSLTQEQQEEQAAKKKKREEADAEKKKKKEELEKVRGLKPQGMPQDGMPFLRAPSVHVSASEINAQQSELKKQWQNQIISARTGNALGGKNEKLVGLVPLYADCHVVVCACIACPHPPFVLLNFTHFAFCFWAAVVL